MTRWGCTGVTTMDNQLVLEAFARMNQAGVFLDPLLVNTVSKTIQEEDDQIERMVQRLRERYARPESITLTLENLPYAPTVMRYCLHNFLISTACNIAHEEAGTVIPSLSTIQRAERRLIGFITQVGIGMLYYLYFVVAGYDLMQPYMRHKAILEEEYLNGIRHFPYESQQLEIFLLIGLAMGSFRLKAKSNGRVVQLTREGQNRYQRVYEILLESKYIDRRIALSYVYQFDEVEDFDYLFQQMYPNAGEIYKQFVAWLQLHDHDQVLEVACGSGGLTYEGELYRIVDRGGHLTAIDASIGMLEQAKRKQSKYDPEHKIHFQQASVENLPFVNGVFDVCVGSAFMHFVDPGKAMAEMKRVVQPGGKVAILQGVTLDMMRPFFRDWFDPVFEIARRRNEDRPQNYLPTFQQIVNWFRDAGLRNIEMEELDLLWVFDDPDVTVQFMVRAVSFFQRELLSLSWDDRRTITMELIDRGRDVCRRYSLAERTIHLPMILIKAQIPL